MSSAITKSDSRSQDEKIEKLLAEFNREKQEKSEISEKLDAVHKEFGIGGWSSESKAFLWMGIIGAVLVALSLFILSYIFVWFYFFMCVIILGFIFSKSHRNFNFTLVIAVFCIVFLIPSSYGQAMLSAADTETLLQDAINDRPDLPTESPILTDFDSINTFIMNLVHFFNWLLILAIVGYGVSTVGDTVSFQWGKVAQKTAMIALAIFIVAFVHSMLRAVDVVVPSPVDELEDIFEGITNFMGGEEFWWSEGANEDNDQQWWEWIFGDKDIPEPQWMLGLDTTLEDTTITQRVNFAHRLIPIMSIPILFVLAARYRNKDLKSIMFADTITEENEIRVKRTEFSIPLGVLLAFMAFYVIAYFLMSSDPVVQVDPLITLVFYIFSVVVVFLMAMDFLIVQRLSHSWREIAENVLLFTVLGLMVLFAWFQFFQPVFYELGMTDYETSLMTLDTSSNEGFGRTFFDQLFLVAMPETLIFQVFPVGLGNRAYHAWKQDRLLGKKIDELKDERARMRATLVAKRQDALSELDDADIDRDTIREVAKINILQMRIAQLNETIEGKESQTLPRSYFMAPLIIFGFIASFLFSWFHSFRRGISFIDWWRNPVLGLTYFGAGMLLTIISFFCYPAAILVHALNNFIAIILAGAL